MRRSPTGLAAVGVPLARLEQASLDARGSTPYFATGRDGSALFVKALGADERSADLLFRVYRRIQPRDLGDERAFSSLRRAVEHEALVALAARDIGIRTPRLAAFATAEPDGFVLAYEAIAGRSLDRLEPGGDDRRGAGRGVGAVRASCARTASPTATCGWPTCSWPTTARRGSSTSASASWPPPTRCWPRTWPSCWRRRTTQVGAERAVAAGLAAVGPDAIATALDRLQLPDAERRHPHGHEGGPGLLPDLRARITTSAALSG